MYNIRSMEIEEAISILETTIKELNKFKPRGTGIRAENVKGLRIEDCVFYGLEKALDVSNSEDITWNRNIVSNVVNNYAKYSELPHLLTQFLTEATKQKTQVNKTILCRIKDQILQRWPELAGTALVVAMMRIIGLLM